MPKIRLPHKYEPRDYQLPLLESLDGGILRAVIVWNRRSGKDKTCWNYTIRKAYERIGTYFYFLPTYTLAKKVIWDNIDSDGFKMINHIPREIIQKKNDSELKVELKNGSVIQLIAANEFEKGSIGTNPIGVVFSEYSVTDENAWKYVSPILAVNGGWAIFNMTPRGMNHGWNLLQQAKQNDKWFSEILTVEDTKVLTPEQLEEERKLFPRDFIEQEYYCKFIEGAGAFFKGVDQVIDKEPFKIDLNRKYQIGIDLAKFNDYTVVTPFDLTTFRVGQQDRFNQIDYNLQKSRIELAYHKYAKGKIIIDSTGVGEPVYDDLKQKIQRIIPFHFTEQSRKDLLVNLQLLIEQGKIKIPNDSILISELKSFRYELSERGKIRISVPEGLHDDCFIAGTKILTNKGNIPIEYIKIGDLVMTRKGLKPVINIRNKVKTVISNIGLTGTPNHPVITTDGEKELQYVCDSDMLYVWNQKLSHIETKNIVDIQNQTGDSLDCIIGSTINGKNHQYLCIGKSGRTTLEKYLKDLLFITKMKIHLIMNWTISKLFLRENTAVYTLTADQSEQSFAFAVKNLHQNLILKQNIVLGTAGRENIERRERVYNLQVFECPEYFANNILVHNCVMSLALSVWDIPERPMVVKNYQDAEDLKNFDFYKKKKDTSYFTGSRYLRK